MNYNLIPETLKIIPQWVVHKNKIPFNPNTRLNAKAGDPSTWGTFDEATTTVCLWDYSGIGFEFDKNGIVGIDLDHAIDPKSKEVHPEAIKIINQLNSYTEISPSGNGFHIITYGEVPKGRKDSQKKKVLKLKFMTKKDISPSQVMSIVIITKLMSLKRLYQKYIMTYFLLKQELKIEQR